jgi:hypothetical protein
MKDQTKEKKNKKRCVVPSSLSWERAFEAMHLWS